MNKITKLLSVLLVSVAFMLSTTGCVSTTEPDWPKIKEVLVVSEGIIGDYQLTLGPSDPLYAKLEKIKSPLKNVISAIDTGQPEKGLVKLASDAALAMINDIEDPKKKQTALRIYFGITTALRLAGGFPVGE